MSIGGAAGPLYGTLLMEMGRELRKSDEGQDFSAALKQAIDAVARRGRSHPGDKTLLDVLYPVQDALAHRSPLTDIVRRAELSATFYRRHEGHARPSSLPWRAVDRPR